MKPATVKLLKWIFLIVISVGLGTFVCNNVLAKTGINVWAARGGGALVAVVAALVLVAVLKLGRTKKDHAS